MLEMNKKKLSVVMNVMHFLFKACYSFNIEPKWKTLAGKFGQYDAFRGRNYGWVVLQISILNLIEKCRLHMSFLLALDENHNKQHKLNGEKKFASVTGVVVDVLASSDFDTQTGQTTKYKIGILQE